jgi:hypothetical protein
MLTMCANSSGTMFGWLAGRYPGLVGNLFGPQRSFTVWPFAPYALDNGAFVAWERGTTWDAGAWLKMLERFQAKPIPPLWAVVPDVVTDRERTIESWHRWLPMVRAAGFAPAFAVQDGMTPADVPPDAQVIFVGGSTAWKWQTMETWCQNFPRVHVGRVNSYGKLMRCYEAGAESTDGTGWFRGRHRQLQGLIDFLEIASGRKSTSVQRRLFGAGDAPDADRGVERQVGQIAYLRPASVRGARREAQAVGTLLEI